MRKVVSSLVLGTLSVCSSVAWAADPPPASEGTDAAPSAGTEATTPAADSPDAKADVANATAPDKDSALVADAEQGSSPVELPGKTYLFVGARYRAIILPKFMMNLFGDGGKTVVAHGFGPEFSIRKNAFEYNLSVWYAGYGMSPTAFKAKDDGEKAWEIVESKLKSVFITADFLWSQDFSPEFSLNYGMAGGFGIIFGDLYRTQARPGPNANPNTGDGFVPCGGKFEDGMGGFCDDSNDHYGGYTEKSWTDGGSKPILFPWLALQTGLRYKPHKNFAARFDAGFGTSGFFLGVGADYGL
ncbi:MAG: hypothetical protein K0R38_2967 [Polyangiaceae bacterium]|jgi:hypothetical protein|nr:hypothetical protein [Polyangiaceae bacterium]